MKIINIYPKSSMKTNLDSDTLWGLLLWGIRHLYSKEEFNSILDDFIKGSPPFIISSSMPMKYSGNITYYLPKPSVKIDMSNIDSSTLKKFKKIKYISLADFNTFTGNKEEQYNYITAGKWSSPEFLSENIQHNTIDRMKGGTVERRLFYSTESFFKSDTGLYFLIKGKLADYAINALKFLSINGIGGDASTGKGHFSFDVSETELFSEKLSGNSFMSLSLYNPKKEEIELFKEKPEIFRYDLVSKKGKTGKFISSANVWKERVTYFKEGSIFPNINKEYYGGCVKVKDDGEFPVYSNGYAFPVFLNSGGL